MNRNEPDLPFQTQLLIGVLLVLTLALGVWAINGWGGGSPPPVLMIDDGTKVIPPHDGQNATICLAEKECYDACRLAVVFADEAQNQADALESRFLHRLPEDDNSSYIDMTKRMMEELQTAYGAQEIASAVCVSRPLVRSRLPEDWQHELELEKKERPKVPA